MIRFFINKSHLDLKNNNRDPLALRYVDISFNYLKKLCSFPVLENLETLDVSFNNLGNHYLLYVFQISIRYKEHYFSILPYPIYEISMIYNLNPPLELIRSYPKCDHTKLFLMNPSPDTI